MTGPPATICSLRLTAGYTGQAPVLKDIALDIAEGETLGLVGESGSGKSTLALALMRLLHLKGGTVTGKIDFQGRDLLAMSEAGMRGIRGNRMAMVLQSPLASLNPAMRLRRQLEEAWRIHADPEGPSFEQQIPELMSSVMLPNDGSLLHRYPRELSVGQAQRMLIAMAVMHRPALLIADEPTSALDIITQREVLYLFSRLSTQRNMALLFISHDLPAVATLCARMAIIRNGEIVECAPTKQILAAPQHEYTKQLLASVPKIDFATGR